MDKAFSALVVKIEKNLVCEENYLSPSTIKIEKNFFPKKIFSIFMENCKLSHNFYVPIMLKWFPGLDLSFSLEHVQRKNCDCAV
jgi:hypothetical protein